MSDPLTMTEVEAEHILACRLTVDARNELHEMGILADSRILEAALAAINKYEQVTSQLLATMQDRKELRAQVEKLREGVETLRVRTLAAYPTFAEFMDGNKQSFTGDRLNARIDALLADTKGD